MFTAILTEGQLRRVQAAVPDAEMSFIFSDQAPIEDLASSSPAVWAAAKMAYRGKVTEKATA
ncbi:MAG: hypothetical protein ACR2RF_10385 [Geminicoccaceae bacterium]